MMISPSILSKVTYHAVYDDSIMDALGYARANGFAGIQVAVEVPHLSLDWLTTQQRAEIGGYRAEHGLRISLHPPDHCCSLVESNQILSRAIRSYYENLFANAAEIGAEIVVLHLGALPSFPTDTPSASRHPSQSLGASFAALRDNLKAVIDLAAGRVILAIENFKLEAETLDVIEPLLGHGGLGLCWDLAKTYKANGELDERLECFYWEHLDHVAQVHLHDIRDGASHRVIGSGRVDFVRFLPRLAGSSVLEYTIEVRPREKAVESLENLRRIVANFDESNPQTATQKPQCGAARN